MAGQAETSSPIGRLRISVRVSPDPRTAQAPQSILDAIHVLAGQGKESITVGDIVAQAPWLVDRDVDDHFRLGKDSWTAVANSGHDDAHLMCSEKRRNGMFVYADLLSTRDTAISWYAPSGGGAYLDSLRWIVDRGAVLKISSHGGLLEIADAMAASVAATVGQITALTTRMTAMLAGGPVTFSELERCVYSSVVHGVIPLASSVAAVHLLEAPKSGARRPAAGGFQLTGAPR